MLSLHERQETDPEISTHASQPVSKTMQGVGMFLKDVFEGREKTLPFLAPSMAS